MISNFLANSRPSVSNFKSLSRSLEHFFLTVGHNNFGKKIPLIPLLDYEGYDDYYDDGETKCHSDQHRIDEDSYFRCEDDFKCTVGRQCGVQGNFNYYSDPTITNIAHVWKQTRILIKKWFDFSRF